MPEIIISDTSCLIILYKIGELELLQKVYKTILTTPEIAEEFYEELPSFITIQGVKDKKYQEFLETQVDPGEASAIALAKEFDSPLLLLDDLKARKLSSKLNLKFTGTLGVIHKAKQLGILKEIKPIIIKLRETNFRISENVLIDLLRKNNELSDK